jgi:hypothetical protein
VALNFSTTDSVEASELCSGYSKLYRHVGLAKLKKSPGETRIDILQLCKLYDLQFAVLTGLSLPSVLGFDSFQLRESAGSHVISVVNLTSLSMPSGKFSLQEPASIIYWDFRAASDSSGRSVLSRQLPEQPTFTHDV